MPTSQNDPWVFRDGRKHVSGEQLLDELRASLRDLRSPQAGASGLLNALIRAGEMEAALGDADSPAASRIAAVTDALAAAFYGVPCFENAAFNFDVSVPSELAISPPEGFSYYALHPLDFGKLALRTVADGRPAAVIGIRSIGTTLSAVVGGALSSSGVQVRRITVRPTGHPYDRALQFTGEQVRWIKEQLDGGARFLIVDEGPGRSGSTFLSVAEALVESGVDAARITMLGSRQPDLGQLCSQNGAQRWTRFRFEAVEPDSHSRFQDHTYIGGGEWRRFLLEGSSEWPASWPQMERLKFLSPDGRRFWKFEGLGRYGEQTQEYSRRLAVAGFGIEVEDGGGGFASYPVIDGMTLRARDVSPALLERISQYCAFRASEFRVAQPSADPLAQMLSFNVQEEFGVDLRLDADDLQCANLVLADGRMQPHEWIQARDGRVYKTDASTHGNDHFFPGPCDIVWDLAGVAVEWELSGDAVEYLLRRFQQLSGDNVRPRFAVYELAYQIFRLASCRMALSTVAGTPEEPRIQRAMLYYRNRAEAQLRQQFLMNSQRRESDVQRMAS